MYSTHHAVVSLLVAAVVTVGVTGSGMFEVGAPTLAIVAYGTAVGVLIDLDHFLIARLKTGRWDGVRFCLSNPAAAVADQKRIFDRGDVGVLSRLLSHVVLIGALVPLHFVVDVGVGIVVAAVLYVHLLTDIVWDIYQTRQFVNADRNDRINYQ